MLIIRISYCRMYSVMYQLKISVFVVIWLLYTNHYTKLWSCCLLLHPYYGMYYSVIALRFRSHTSKEFTAPFRQLSVCIRAMLNSFSIEVLLAYICRAVATSKVSKVLALPLLLEYQYKLDYQRMQVLSDSHAGL